jgi:hypothetical protein
MALSRSLVFPALLFVASILPDSCHAQARQQTIDESLIRPNAPLVFIDCRYCDFTYIRQTISFANFVHEPHQAQIHVLVTRQTTAAGGRKYRLIFMGRKNFQDQDHELDYVSLPSVSQDEERRGLTRVLKAGLLLYAVQTPLAPELEIIHRTSEPDQGEKPEADAWDYWVFRVDLGGGYQAETSLKWFRVDCEISADRITDMWRFQSSIDLEFDREKYKDEEVTITGRRSETDGDISLVRSLSSRWSAGVFGKAESNTYKNIKFGMRFAPAVEYNIFPWEVCNRKILTIGYTAGIRSYRYLERTLYDKTSEFLSYESLKLELRLIQPWGEVDASLEGSHYFFDMSKKHLTFNSSVSLRLIKGFSLAFHLDAQSVHDQLFLPAGDATREEILLKQKQLATDYEINFFISLRYTFGSIYNNIVNLRL